MNRIRVSYEKNKEIRYTSALDMQKIWEHACRRSSIRITYSQGFHPQPKIQLGNPLPLGFISSDEKVDIWLEDTVDLTVMQSKVQNNLPAGIKITSIDAVVLSEPSLVSKIQYSEYHVYFYQTEILDARSDARITDFLAKSEIIRIKRNGKKYDLRPLILDIKFRKNDHDVQFYFLKLLSQSNRTGRPDEVMLAMGYSLTDFLIKRTGSFTG